MVPPPPLSVRIRLYRLNSHDLVDARPGRGGGSKKRPSDCDLETLETQNAHDGPYGSPGLTTCRYGSAPEAPGAPGGPRGPKSRQQTQGRIAPPKWSWLSLKPKEVNEATPRGIPPAPMAFGEANGRFYFQKDT